MAVEKLILRSILYGADKIPDSWFEKLPGGFYKDAQGHAHKKRSGSGEMKSRRDRMYDGRKAECNDFYPEKNRSERGRRRDRDRGRSRSSYDGGADDNYYYSGDDRPQRSKSHRRRRSLDDNDRYGYDDGHGRGRRDEHGRRPRYGYDGDRNGLSSYHREPDYGRRRSAAYLDRPPTRFEPRPFEPGSFATAAAAEVGAGAAEPPYPRGNYPVPIPTQSYPSQPRNGGISNGYVPYAHIYGNLYQQPSPQGGSPAPAFDDFVLPNSRTRASPVVPSPQGCHQNPLAQQAPTAADTGAGAAYTGQAGIISQDARNINGYDENDHPHSESPSPTRHSSRQDYSPSFDSFDSHGDERRSRGDRQNDKGRSKSERYVDPRKPLNSQVSTQKPTSNR